MCLTFCCFSNGDSFLLLCRTCGWHFCCFPMVTVACCCVRHILQPWEIQAARSVSPQTWGLHARFPSAGHYQGRYRRSTCPCFLGNPLFSSLSKIFLVFFSSLMHLKSSALHIYEECRGSFFSKNFKQLIKLSVKEEKTGTGGLLLMFY